MLSPGSKNRRFAGLKDLIDHLNAVGSRGLAAIGSKSSRAKLQDDEKTVTLQVGRSVFADAPRNMRTELWMSSLQRKGIGVAASQRYHDMLQTPVGDEAAADIDKDLGRTFPTLKRFAAADGQEALRRVLRAYAALDPEVGYCQGMNFVAGLLLMYLPEASAFGGLVVLMQDRGLRKYYSTDMSLLQTHLWQLGRLIPARLCSHLESIGVLPLLYGASWLMTCFSADFPASFSARVMDVIMADKMDQALLKAAVALLKRCEPQLLQMHDMEDALHLLKLELPAWEEALLHDVLSDAFSKPWSSRQLQLLGSLEGAETVAEALTRVQRTNLAASMDSLHSADSNADDAASGSSRAATPTLLSASAAAAATAGTAGASTGSGGGAGSSAAEGARGTGGGVAGAAVLPLFPPPPSPKRPSSTGGGASGGLSPACSRPVSRSPSQSGAVHGGADSRPTPAAAAAVAAAGSEGVGLPRPAQVQALQPQQQQQPAGEQHVQSDMIDMSSPRASITAGADGVNFGGTADSACVRGSQQQQQQQRQDLDGSSWDPFGLCETSHKDHHHQPQQQQQQQQPQQPTAGLQAPWQVEAAQEAVVQELQGLSFTGLSSPQAGPSHQAPQQQQRQQQQLTEDDWGDFLSPHPAH